MEYIIILIVAIVIFLFIKNFTKRKLTFTVLAISFLLSIIPCSMGVIDIGDGPGDGFIILIIYMIILLAGVEIGKCSKYYFYKNYFILWILMIGISIKGIKTFKSY